MCLTRDHLEVADDDVEGVAHGEDYHFGLIRSIHRRAVWKVCFVDPDLVFDDALPLEPLIL